MHKWKLKLYRYRSPVQTGFVTTWTIQKTDVVYPKTQSMKHILNFAWVYRSCLRGLACSTTWSFALEAHFCWNNLGPHWCPNILDSGRCVGKWKLLCCKLDHYWFTVKIMFRLHFLDIYSRITVGFKIALYCKWGLQDLLVDGSLW